MASTYSKYKPVGWRGDSHRHYLAAKGIKTHVNSHRFFANIGLAGADPDQFTGFNDGPAQNSFTNLSSAPELLNELPAEEPVNNAGKGNDTSSELHRAHAKGYTVEDLLNNEALRKFYNVDLNELLRSKRGRKTNHARSKQLQFDSTVEEPLPSPIATFPQGQTGNGVVQTGERISNDVIQPDNEQSVETVRPILDGEEGVIDVIPGNTVITPGTPNRSNDFTVGGPLL